MGLRVNILVFNPDKHIMKQSYTSSDFNLESIRKIAAKISIKTKSDTVKKEKNPYEQITGQNF